MAAAVVIAIAGSVLLSFNRSDDRWPAIDLPVLDEGKTFVSTAAFATVPAVINFWASWCAGCREEHSVLADLAQGGRVAVFGVNHLDDRADALRWLRYYGDPYTGSVFDEEGRIAAQLAIVALPVSLVVDSSGVIRYRHLGPLDAATVDSIILPLIEDLRRED
jgi:cytochrome c biogenesis protein CcmG/thiol:disulfide interchange protein DsbE